MPLRIQATREIVDGFHILNMGFVASYVLDAGDSLLAFDAGMKGSQILSHMKALNLDPGKVLHLFLTHSDPDHVGGINAFPNAKPFISKDEVAMLDGTTARFFGKVFSKPLPFTYDTLEDGQELMVCSAKVMCLSTPGHTSGSMSYLINDSILVVGDEMNLRKGKAVLNMKFINVDNGKREESIRRLAKTRGVKLLCTAHSGYTDSFDFAMDRWGN